MDILLESAQAGKRVVLIILTILGPGIMGSAGGCGDLESWDNCFHLRQQILSEYEVVTRFMLDFHFQRASIWLVP